MSDIKVDSAAKHPIQSPSNRKVALGCLLSLVLPIAIIAAALGAKGGPLPTPRLTSGRVVDADTLDPIQGATVTYRWWIQDYPAMDGGRPSNAFKVEFVTDSNGDFSYVPPAKRKGLWLTDEYPPEITANGYFPNTQVNGYSGYNRVNSLSNSRIENGTRLILMKPEQLRPHATHPDDSTPPFIHERREAEPR